jgi:simple sugar transport system ATP-binding protein
MASDLVVELRNVTKRFAGVTAIKDISLAIRRGEIHCVLGDNGAGKSTLIKLLSGYFQPSDGEIWVDGVRVNFAGPRDARALGIATVHQDYGAIPLMSIGRNFFLGSEPTKSFGPFKQIDFEAANRIAVEQMHKIGIRRVSKGEQLVGTLSGGERQAMAIARAVYFGARVLILDEPTSALGVKETAQVLKLMRAVRDEGVSVIFITHNAGHALSVGDQFAILNQGRLETTFRHGEKTREELLNLMSGGEWAAGVDAFEDD